MLLSSSHCFPRSRGTLGKKNPRHGSSADPARSNQVFPRDVFSDKVREHAHDLASSASPRSLRVIKRQVYGAMFQTLAEAFETSEREMLASLQSEDFKEGVAHFLEKRAPVFSGR
ncbi:MAG: hypothetical protein DMG29_05160 [Acidobacteria bacterium]|nr:MAG: hypothetical protein DMG29_05160 [Acidobacteriota bacterium]